MKRYLLKTLQDTVSTWAVLEIGIISSSVLYAVLSIEGIPENTSLLVAFLGLVGLLILGLLLFSVDSFVLRLPLQKPIWWKQSQSNSLKEIADSFVAQQRNQTILLEKLTQNLEDLALEHELRVGQFTQSLVTQQKSVEQIALFRLEEQKHLENIIRDLVTQQERFVQIAESAITQQRSFEQALLEGLRTQESFNQLVQDLAYEILKLTEKQRIAMIDTAGTLRDQTAMYSHATSLPQEVSNPGEEATILNNAAGVYRALERYDEALAYYERVLSITREVGNRAEEATILNNMADVYRALERYDEALAYYERALSITREVGNRARE